MRGSSYARATGPDFVLVGIPADDGVFVYASDHLWAAEFHVDSEAIDTGWPGHRVIQGPSTITITTTGGDLRVAKGRTYGEAITALFRDWQPKDPERKGLPAATPELEEDTTDWEAQAGRGGW